MTSDLGADGVDAVAGHGATAHAAEFQGGVDDTSETLAGDEAGGGGEAVRLEALGEVLPPPPRSDGAGHDGVGVAAVGAEDPGDTDGHPVGEVLAVLHAVADEVEVLDDGLEGADDAHDDGEDGAGLGDGELGHGDGLGDGLPGEDGGGTEGARLLGPHLLPDAGVGGHEQDKDAGREEDADAGADGLGVELQVGGRAQEEADAEVGDQGGGDVGGTRGDTAGDEVDALGGLDVEALAGGDAAKDELGGLGGGGERGAVGDGAAVDAEEGEEQAEDAGEDGEAGVHVELDVADDAGDGGEDEGAGGPDPDGHLLARGRKVLDEAVLGVGHAGVLGEEGVVLAARLHAVVDAAGAGAEGELCAVDEDADVQDELDHGVDDEDHDAGPQHPVARGRHPVGVVADLHDAKVDHVGPLLALGVSLDAHGLAVVHEGRSDDAPGDKGPEPPGQGGVDSDEHAGAEEGGDVEPQEDVPVVQNAIGVLGDDDVDEGAGEAVTQGLDLLGGVGGSAADGVHGADGQGGRGGWVSESAFERRAQKGEARCILPGDVDDEELAQGHGREEAEEGAGDGDGQDAAKVLTRVLGHEVELVHGGEGGDEETGHAAGTGGSGLDDGAGVGAC
ncbi:hypothetical protein CTA2_1829 [Colletotrichum tanaceti]|uniref:Uncharacterized protein n=1 Tax=Colletotrichum tanaceti TaxID=1306861 RepID=A0A4U6X7D2_9PEZI|nr:hypothetical protein CTA2_1829 [Colletotrichum tanaceti]TKW51401.1 hypothetical protein CTA1_4391 [Colletotrichum tanaceti]